MATALSNPHVSAIKHHSTSWQQKVSALVVEVTYKAKTPKSADNQLLPTAPSGLDGMRRNVMANGNQSKLLGLGGRGVGLGGGRGGDGREWKAECAFDLSENWSQACRYCVCGGQQQRQQADISERARGLVFRDTPPSSHGSFYWISERNVHKMTTVLLKTECRGNIGQGGKKSDHGKWNESMALKVLAASACPHPSALSGNFLL